MGAGWGGLDGGQGRLEFGGVRFEGLEHQSAGSAAVASHWDWIVFAVMIFD